jgi:16S rRNA G966 N2-methylase RsmD
MNLCSRTAKSILEKGLTRTFQSLISVIEDYCFEKWYGTNTSEIIEVQDLDITQRHKKHSFRYQPTRVRHFNKLMKILDLPAVSVFVDLGSGKGRVLLMASRYGFKRIVGIEVSPQLCKIARDNVSIYEKRLKRPLNVTVVESDVLQYSISDDENVFYFFKPFDDYMMEKIIEKIKNSLLRNPRKVWLIFNNFQYNELIETDQQFERFREFAYGGTEFVVYVAKTNT